MHAARGTRDQAQIQGPQVFLLSAHVRKLYLGLGLGETTSPVIRHSIRAHFLLQAVRVLAGGLKTAFLCYKNTKQIKNYTVTIIGKVING
jgi:hypothetical protein